MREGVTVARPTHAWQRKVPATFLCALCLVGSSSLGGAQPKPNGAETADWTRVVTVSDERAAGQVLEMIFHQVSATGIGGSAAAAVLKRVGVYIDAQISERGQATLSVGLVVSAVASAKAASWSPEDMSRFAVALHREFDRQQRPDVAQLQRITQKVRLGAAATEILGVGETLKEAAPGR